VTNLLWRKDEWDTKEGTGKSMKNALCIQWHGKRAKAKKIKLAIYTSLKVSVRQAGKQSVS